MSNYRLLGIQIILEIKERILVETPVINTQPVCQYICLYKCICGLMDHSMNLLTNSDIHKYNTRNKDMLRLPRVTRNWGKQRVCHHSLKDWNKLKRETRNAPNIATFKRNVFARFFN